MPRNCAEGVGEKQGHFWPCFSKEQRKGWRWTLREKRCMNSRADLALPFGHVKLISMIQIKIEKMFSVLGPKGEKTYTSNHMASYLQNLLAKATMGIYFTR